MKKLLIILFIIGTSFSCTSYTCPTYSSTDNECIGSDCTENAIVRTPPSKTDLLVGYTALIFIIVFAANNKQ